VQSGRVIEMKISPVSYKLNYKINNKTNFQTVPMTLKQDVVEISFKANKANNKKEFHRNAMQIASLRYEEGQRILMQGDDIMDGAEALWKRVYALRLRAEKELYFRDASTIYDFMTDRKIKFSKNSSPESIVAQLYEKGVLVKSISWNKENVVVFEHVDTKKTNNWLFDCSGNLISYMKNSQQAYKGQIYEQSFTFSKKGLSSYLVKNKDAQIFDEIYSFENGAVKGYQNSIMELANGAINYALSINYTDAKNYDYISNSTTAINGSNKTKEVERALRVIDGKVVYDSKA